MLSAEKLYIQLATHRDIPTSIVRILGLPTGHERELILNKEQTTYPRKVYTQQPRGTMNLDNSYFRQESETPSLPNQQTTEVSPPPPTTTNEDLLAMASFL